MAIDFAYPAPACGEEDSRPLILSKVHYSYYGSLGIVITSIGIVVFSLISEKPSKKQVGLHIYFPTSKVHINIFSEGGCVCGK